MKFSNRLERKKLNSTDFSTNPQPAGCFHIFCSTARLLVDENNEAKAQNNFSNDAGKLNVKTDQSAVVKVWNQ